MAEKKPKVDKSAQPKKSAFLSAYALLGSVTAACKASDVSRTAHYEWLKDPEYVAQFEQAKLDAADVLEQEARRRAVQGVRRLKFHKGEPIMLPNPEDPEGEPVPYFEHEYSDTLLIFLMKGAMPEKYRERQEVKHEILEYTPKERKARIAELLNRAGMAGASDPS